MDPDAVCLLCAKPVPDAREFHDACWPEAKRHVDAVVEMARRKYGPDFAVQVIDFPDQYPVVHPLPVGRIIGGEVIPGPPIEPEPLAEENRKNLEFLEDAVAKAAQEEFLKPPCICQKDADNRCPTCIETICAHVKSIVQLQMDYMEKQSKLKQVEDVCDACSNEYCDFSLARIVKEVFGKMLEYAGSRFEPTVRELILAMRGQFERKGIRAWPLLDRAVAELFKGGPPPDESVA